MLRNSVQRFIVAGALIPLLAGAVACRNRPTTTPRRAILILLDAARPDRFSCYGYERETTPNMDRLARRGVIYRNNFSQATATVRSLPAIFFSRYISPPLFPASTKVPLSEPSDVFYDFDDASISIPRLMATAGLKTCAISAHPWTRPNTDFSRQFEELHDLPRELHSSTEIGAVHGERVTDRALGWLRKHKQDSFFLYLHYMDTHMPHRFGPEAKSFYGGDPGAEASRQFRHGGWPKDRQDVLDGPARRYLDALYDGDLRHVDTQIGRLIDWLRDQGMLDSTLIAITSDHGEGLLQIPGRFEHGGPWYDTVARTPLIIFNPSRLKPGVVEHVTESVDIEPTIAAVLGIRIPPGKHPDGVALTDRAKLAARGAVALSTQGIRTPEYKLLMPHGMKVLASDTPDDASALLVNARLYDLSKDPDETSNVLQDQRETGERLALQWAQRLEPDLRRFHATSRKGPPDSAFAISARHFQLEPAKAAGWELSRHWRNYKLADSPHAEPIAVTIRLPNGIYKLSARLRGDMNISVDGQMQPATEKSEANSEDHEPETGEHTLQLGEIQITDNRFVAHLAVTSPDRLGVLRYFGFDPVGATGESEQDQKDYEKRLRALGYIN